jgi:hypothetical protein
MTQDLDLEDPNGHETDSDDFIPGQAHVEHLLNAKTIELVQNEDED